MNTHSNVASGSQAIGQWTPQAAPPVPGNGATTALSRLEHVADVHTQTLATLLQRLETGGVLRPAAPTATSNGPKDGTSLSCAIAVTVHSQASRIQAMTAALQDVIDRLDV